MPSNPFYRPEPGGHKYEIESWFEHLVSEYTGLNLYEIQDLTLTDYLLLRRDAFINALNGSEKGREYLDKAWILEQTEPDRNALRQKYGKKEAHNAE